MRIVSLKIKNFRSYGETVQTIRFSKGLSFIVGPNGSGKTNVLRAIQLVANCLHNYSLDLASYDPEIEISLEITLSKAEQKLLGSILCINIYREIKELFNPDKFGTLRDMTYKNLIDKFDENQLYTIFQKLQPILKIAIPENEKFSDRKMEEKKNLLVSHINQYNFSEVKEILKRTDFEPDLGILRKDYYNNIKNYLHLEETHKIIGEIFKDIEFKLSADVTRINTCVLLKWQKKNIKLDSEYLKIGNDRSETDNFPKFVHNYLQHEDVIISSDFLRKALIEHFSLANPPNISIPRLDIKFGIGETKNLLHKILPQLKEIYEDKFSSDKLLSLFDIIKQIFKTKTIIIPEHRGLIEEDSLGVSYLTLPKLSKLLYSWKNAHMQSVRKRFYYLQKSFNDIFKMKFDIYVKETETTIENEKPFLTLETVKDSDYSSQRLGNETKGVVQWDKIRSNWIKSEPFIQFVTKENVPIEIQDAPSGAYETLMILTSLYEIGDKTIIIDEPARALHPQLQRKISYKVFGNIKGDETPTFILITHSPYFITDFQKTSIWKCIRGEILPFDITLLEELKLSSKSHKNEINAAKFLERIDSVTVLLFAERVLVVEGYYDRLFIKELDRKYGESFGLEKYNWDFIILGGKDQFPIVWKLMKQLKTEFLAVLDRDSAFFKHGDEVLEDKKYPKFTSSTIGHIASEFNINNDLEQFYDKTLLDIEQDEQLFEEIFQLLLKENIFVWKVGKLEDVIEKITNEKLDIEKIKKPEIIYDVVENLTSRISNYSLLQELVEKMNQIINRTI